MKQTVAVTRMNLENLGSRAGSSATVVVGSVAVVAVLLGLLAMSAGFRSALVETAKPDRGLILRNGSNNEMDGWIGLQELAILEAYEGFEVTSGEVYTTLTEAWGRHCGRRRMPRRHRRGIRAAPRGEDRQRTHTRARKKREHRRRFHCAAVRRTRRGRQRAGAHRDARSRRSLPRRGRRGGVGNLDGSRDRAERLPSHLYGQRRPREAGSGRRRDGIEPAIGRRSASDRHADSASRSSSPRSRRHALR